MSSSGNINYRNDVAVDGPSGVPMSTTVPVPPDVYDLVKTISVPGGASVNKATYYEAVFRPGTGPVQEPFDLEAPELPADTFVTLRCWPWEPVSMGEDGTLWKRKCEVT